MYSGIHLYISTALLEINLRSFTCDRVETGITISPLDGKRERKAETQEFVDRMRGCLAFGHEGNVP